MEDNKISKESFNIITDKILQLKKIIPECFTEGILDIEKLCKTLGQTLDAKDEKYTFSWAGRNDTFKNIQTSSKGTLIPDKTESINFDETENIFIEGENLEVLKLLQKSYFERIKMIYIDPPYNIGTDKIYKDDFKTGVDNYLKQTNQAENGIKLTTNPQTSGRFHSDWISFMFARLYVARNLLHDNGVIFVSIDEHELHNLRIIMNEIFGEENLAAHFVWRKTDNQANIGNIACVKDHILCFAKNLKTISFNKMKLTERALKEYRYGNVDNKFRRDILLHKTRGKHHYNVTTPSGKILTGPWMILENKFRVLEENDGIYWASGKEEQPYGKIFQKDVEGMISNDFLGIEFGTNQQGSNELAELFGERIFDFPKPVSLIQHFITLATNENDIVLDFFSGSGTTAHAILDINQKTQSNRKFICIQIPEIIDEKLRSKNYGLVTISEVCVERIKKVILRINQNINDNPQIGFKIFNLTKSNFRIWENYEGKDEKELKEQLKLFESPLIAKYKDEDVIYECIIKEGFDLNSKIESIIFESNKIYKIYDDTRMFYLTLDKSVKSKIIYALDLTKEQTLIYLDAALSDSDKSNLSKQYNLKTL